MKEKDPTIDRIREVRHQISAEFGHDPEKLVAHYANLEKEFAGRFAEERKAELEPEPRSEFRSPLRKPQR
jgi:hypothetical protein